MKTNYILLFSMVLLRGLAQVPTTSLVLYYPFNGNANDASGNSYNGTVNGCTLTADRFNNSNAAYSFNGTSNYISRNSSPITNDVVFTISAWIYRNTSITRPIVNLGFTGAWTLNELAFSVATNNLTMETPGANGITSTSTVVPVGSWAHVAVVHNTTGYTTSAFKFYVNGIEYTSNTISGANVPFPVNNLLAIGVSRGGAGSNYYFDGKIDDIRIYSRVLTPCEILELYNENITDPLNTVPASPSLCIGNSAVITATGAVTYTWAAGVGLSSTTGTSVTASPTISTTYTLSGTNSSGCIHSKTISVTVNSLPVISISGSTSICSGTSNTLTALGASTYTWNGSITSNSLISTTTVNTTFSVVGTNTNGCVNSTSILVTALPLPTLSIFNPVNSICLGSNLTFSAGGASSYTWTGGPINGIPYTPSVTGAFTHSVIGTSSAGCLSANAVMQTLTVNPNPFVVVNSGSICSGTTFTIMPTGANTYTFSNGSNTVSPNTNTSYSITGTSTAGCVSSNTAVSNVSVIALPTISVNSGSICSGQIFTIQPTGANTYTISGGTSTVSPSINTTYSVTGTSSLGCVSANTALSTVTVNAVPSISVNSGAICAGKTFTIIPNGASTYTVTGGSMVVSPNISTSYSVLGTSAQGCLSSGVAVSNVTVNPLPIILVTSSQNKICSGETVTLTSSGASAFLWNTGATTPSIIATLTATTIYSVTGTDANGCGNTTAFTQSVDACTGIQENNMGLDLILFPNPSNSVLNIVISGYSGSNIEINIYSMDGKLLQSSVMAPQDGRSLADVSNLENGMYLTEIKTGGLSVTKRIVILR